MSSLSGYDSEVTGFDCLAQDTRSTASSSTQTSDYSECGAASQTNASKDIGCMVNPEDINAEDDVLREYPPPGLNEFLRKVVPCMLEQLDQNDNELTYNTSDADEEECVAAKLLQEIKLKSDGLGAGDHHTSILAVSWSSAGNSIAVSIGQSQHETWCETPGLIQIFMLKRSEGDKFVHEMDISEKNCVTVLKYHPTLAALLAYGTTSGEVVLCDLRNGSLEEGTQLTSPSGCHGSRRVSALKWADSRLANTFLLMQINNKGKRRGASDQILMSAGSDGTLNVWQVNANLKIFENVVCYNINGSKKMPAPDLSCFDFVKNAPLHASAEKMSDEVFVVGTKSGKLYLCNVKNYDHNADPVYEVLEGHSTCVLDVAFGFQKPGIFVSVSMDSELRVYDITQNGPLKVICLDIPISSMGWLQHPCVVVGLSASERRLLKVYNVMTGREVAVEGFDGTGTVTSLSIHQSGGCRIAAGTAAGTVSVWSLPARVRPSCRDLDCC